MLWSGAIQQRAFVPARVCRSLLSFLTHTSHTHTQQSQLFINSQSVAAFSLVLRGEGTATQFVDAAIGDSSYGEMSHLTLDSVAVTNGTVQLYARNTYALRLSMMGYGARTMLSARAAVVAENLVSAAVDHHSLWLDVLTNGEIIVRNSSLTRTEVRLQQYMYFRSATGTSVEFTDCVLRGCNGRYDGCSIYIPSSTQASLTIQRCDMRNLYFAESNSISYDFANVSISDSRFDVQDGRLIVSDTGEVTLSNSVFNTCGPDEDGDPRRPFFKFPLWSRKTPRTRFRSHNITVHGCEEYNSCADLFYFSYDGLVECMACPEGQFSVNGIQCKSCYPGMTRNDFTNECELCDEGFIQNGTSVCVPCPTLLSNDARTECLPCDNAHYGFDLKTGERTCFPCSATSVPQMFNGTCPPWHLIWMFGLLVLVVALPIVYIRRKRRKRRQQQGFERIE